MKKNIIIGLSLFSLIFFIGGIYLITAIESSTSKLDNLITLHQVEILREHLLLQIKRVQSDINLKNTRYARNIDTVVNNVKNMEHMADTCFDCHHTEEMQKRLYDLRNDILEYKRSVSRLFTIRANTQRLEEEEDKSFKKGELLVGQVNGMITMASMKLEKKTQTSLKDIARTKKILYLLVMLVPFLAGGLGYIFIRGFTRPVNLLLSSTRRLEEGDLDHRIEGLKNEFGEVAASINKMSGSLKEHMHKFEENEKRYRMLFESAGDAIFMIDIEGENAGNIVSANPAAAKMHGYTVGELLKLNLIKDLDTPEAAADAAGRIQRMMSGEWIKSETTHRRKDGTVFPVEISAGLFDFMGHKYVLAFDRDITERKEFEESLKRAEQMKLVGEWAAGLAHEIKNSLAGIKISIELLIEDAAVPEDDRDSILKAIDEIKRIELLLKSLLSFARPSKLDLQTTNVNEILDNAISYSLMQSALSPGIMDSIRITKHLDETLPYTMADRLQLRQVFMNVLINACQAMQDGGELTVRTSHDPAAHEILIEISDTGEGIDGMIIDKIFQPFFTTKSRGTGLGLAITKRIVEQHGGRISIANRPGSGIVFDIRLPVNKGKKERNA